jgi:hypothetical protein
VDSLQAGEKLHEFKRHFKFSEGEIMKHVGVTLEAALHDARLLTLLALTWTVF